MEEKKVQKRKVRAKNGEKTSKMVSFRADELTIKILRYVENKGLLINRLIKGWGYEHCVIDDPHADPKENDIEEYFT